MAVTRWDPFMALARMDRDFDELVRRTWGTGTSAAAAGGRGFVPAVEMFADGDDVIIRLELPGIDPAEDVDIEIAPGKLTIRGERKMTAAEDRGGVIVRELRYGSFAREFALPEGVDESAVEARYDQGMLEVAVRGVVRRPPEPKKIEVRKTDSSRVVESGAHHDPER